jgi:hypothetical protein
MSETAARPTGGSVVSARVAAIVEVQHQKDLFELQLRQHLVGLSQDWGFGSRSFVADDLAIVLSLSCGQVRRMLELAELSVAHPTLAELVVGRAWSLKHHDAVLEEIAGQPEPRQSQIVAAVLASGARTPFQLRRAAQAALYLLDPQAAEDRARAARDHRAVGARVGLKGDATFWADGSKAEVAQLMAAVDVIAERRQPGDTRTLGQRRVDALMDLVCGRVLPGQWQAIVLVEESTLRGADTDPAEIPGFGLVTAGEARELAGQAQLRRAVVDADGHLVSVDSSVSRPDATPARDEERVLTDAVEPARAVAEGETVPAQEWAWLAAAEAQAGYDFAVEVAQQRELARGLQPDAFSQQVLGELLAYVHAHTRFPGLTHIVQDGQTGVFSIAFPEDPRPPDGGGVGPPDLPPLPGPHGPAVISHTRHRPDTPASAGGGDTRPDPAPGGNDLEWFDEHTDHDAAHALLAWQHVRSGTAPSCPPPPGGWPLDPACRPPRPAWTQGGYRQVLRRFRSRPAEPAPAASSSYAFPPRAARHIKLRDLHCVFPGCYRHAQRCHNDHVVAWPLGPTHIANAASECEHHHQYKHHHAASVVRLLDGTVRWTTRSGHVADTPPRRLIRGW